VGLSEPLAVQVASTNGRPGSTGIDSRTRAVGSFSTGTKLTPSFGCGPVGVGNPASSASVGKMSTLSASCLVEEQGFVTPGATIRIGIRFACS